MAAPAGTDDDLFIDLAGQLRDNSAVPTIFRFPCFPLSPTTETSLLPIGTRSPPLSKLITRPESFYSPALNYSRLSKVIGCSSSVSGLGIISSSFVEHIPFPRTGSFNVSIIPTTFSYFSILNPSSANVTQTSDIHF